MRRKFYTISLVMTLTALTMTISGTVFATPNKGSDCSRCHNSTPPPPPPAADTTPPTVSNFSIPSTATSLTVAIARFTATDNLGVTGYLVAQTAAVPLASSAGWSASAPGSYSFTTAGTKTLYAWTKDAAGNVSASRSASVTITLPDPTPTPSPTPPSISAPQKATGSSCTKTSTDVWKSCNFGADDDYWLAIAKCDNLFTSNDLKACKKQASEERISGKEDCMAQLAVRKEICKDLGQASYNPVISPADFSTTIDNPYFPLKPKTTFIYEGTKDGKIEHVEVKVTDKTKVILGVTCVEVRDTGTIDGVLAEDTLDWYAQDKDGNVWYFGENSVEYDANGEIGSLEGSWKAGVDGAMPGIIMKAAPQVNDLYRQEYALGTAEDMAEVLSLNESLLVNSVTYNRCLKTKEFSPLEPDALENKFYAPGVGNIQTVDVATGKHLDLVQITTE